MNENTKYLECERDLCSSPFVPYPLKIVTNPTVTEVQSVVGIGPSDNRSFLSFGCG